ncbi:MAG: nucleotidyl transferase AbiEii/AbiGii toxin family protein [Myxococcota bacterium]
MHPPEAASLRALEGVVRRLRWTGAFVLRGSLLTRQWVAPFPRSVGDLDLVGIGDDDVGRTLDRLRDSLDTDGSDGVLLDLVGARARGLWRSTAFPGVRVTLPTRVLDRPVRVSLDIGFGDPLVPGSERLVYRPLDGDPFEVEGVALTTQLAWKLHGLAEWSVQQWRPKDLLDLWLLADREVRPAPEITNAIRVAFESRGLAPHVARDVLLRPEWDGPIADRIWDRFRSGLAGLPPGSPGSGDPLPTAPAMLRDGIVDRLMPALEPL